MQIFSTQTGAIGTNTYLVWDEESGKGFIVDPGAYSSDISAKIRELGMEPEYILITHGHADHIMGVEEFREEFPQIRVVACSAEKEMLCDMNMNMSTQFGRPTEISADIYVEDNETLSIGNLGLEFLFTPGHSPGGMCIYIREENTLFSGDTLFRASIGRTDFPGCSFEALSESVHEKLFILPDETAVYPGHMGTTTIGFEKVNNPFV